MATAAELQGIDWKRYVADFLDSNSFTDSKAAAEAIGAQVRAEFGPCDTMLVEIEAGCEWNRRAQAEERRARNEWLEEARAGFAALSQDERDEFAAEVEWGMI